MTILDICTKMVIFCEKAATLRQAAQLMKKHNVGSLLVAEFIGSNKTVGIITDRDIVLGIAVDNHNLNTQVGSIMSNDIFSVPANTEVSEIIDLMEKEGKRRVVVVDNTGGMVGIVSTDDILQLLAREMKGLSNLFTKQQYKIRASKLLQESFLT